MTSTHVGSALNLRSRVTFLLCGKAIWISYPLPTHLQFRGLQLIPFFSTRRVFIFHWKSSNKESANQIMSPNYHFLVPSPATHGEEQLGNGFWSKEMWLHVTFRPPHIQAFKSVESLQKSPSFCATHPSHFCKEFRGRMNTNDISHSKILLCSHVHQTSSWSNYHLTEPTS